MLQYMRIQLAAKVGNERGATAVEYGLLVALIAAGIVTLVALLGDQIAEGFTNVTGSLTSNGIDGK